MRRAAPTSAPATGRVSAVAPSGRPSKRVRHHPTRWRRRYTGSTRPPVASTQRRGAWLCCIAGDIKGISALAGHASASGKGNCLLCEARLHESYIAGVPHLRVLPEPWESTDTPPPISSTCPLVAERRRWRSRRTRGRRRRRRRTRRRTWRGGGLRAAKYALADGQRELVCAATAWAPATIISGRRAIHHRPRIQPM